MPLNGLGGYAMNYFLHSIPFEAMNSTSEISESEIDSFYIFNGFDDSGNVILKLLKNIFKVTFNSNGGRSVTPITGIDKDATVTLPSTPTKTDYEFGGWFTGI